MVARDASVDGKGAQIDLVIDRSDHCINLCEMKFAVGKFNISGEYEDKLRNRMQIFREKTKTGKSLFTTFVTTFGVADGIHRGIVDNQVLADDLFTK